MARDAERRGKDRAVYIISVAAELSGVHPQTLRIYERKGLLSPARTSGNTRRYSERDIERLRAIQRLTQEHGVNLAGAKMIIELQNEMERMREQLLSMRSEMTRLRERMDRRGGGELVPRSQLRETVEAMLSWT